MRCLFIADVYLTHLEVSPHVADYDFSQADDCSYLVRVDWDRDLICSRVILRTRTIMQAILFATTSWTVITWHP